MAYQDGSYRDGVQQIDAGTSTNAFDNYNFAETRSDGLFIQNSSVRFDPVNGRGEAAITAAAAGQGGCTAQIGQRIEVNGSPSDDLYITVDADWRGILEIIGAGGSSMTMKALLVEDDGPLFPSVGDSSVLDSIGLVSESADVTNTGSPIVKDGSVFSHGNPSPLIATNPSNGDRYRVVVFVQTTAFVPYSFASARSDANSNSANAFNGYIRMNALYFDWR